MKLGWLAIGCLVCATGCGSDPMNGGPESEWKLSEDDAATNNVTANNVHNRNDDDDANDDVDTDDDINNVTSNNVTANNVIANNNVNNRNDDDHCLGSAPERHRSAADTCDDSRTPGSTPSSGYGGPIECETDSDCSDGENGRCTGNNHDGWYCTYDQCFADDGCGGNAVCECGGGFRSDHNICVAGNCRTDADCETGYCSPSFGSCGNYVGTVGYFCHTCEDECVNDSDCGATDDGDPWGDPYCMYDEGVGYWRCAETHCVG